MKDRRTRFNKIKRKQKMRQSLLLAGALLSAAAFITGLTMGKYVSRWQSPPALASANTFYFTSDLLKSPEEKASYKLYSWEDGISIRLQNFEDAKRYSEPDITYTVSCTPAEGTSIEAGSGTLKGNAASNGTVVIRPEPGAKSVTVTAVTTAPYRKELTAIFTLQKTAQPRFQVSDAAGNPSAELIIKGGNSKQSFTLVWNNTQIMPDRTNPLLKFSADGTATIEIAASGSCSIILFKKDPSQNYGIKEQDITDKRIPLNIY
jgi:hypothetical protein